MRNDNNNKHIFNIEQLDSSNKNDAAQKDHTGSEFTSRYDCPPIADGCAKEMKKLKKILVCTIDAWNSKTAASTSNTFMSILKDYPPENIANIYIREEYPDSEICGSYFRISERLVIKSLLNRKTKTGKVIQSHQQMTDADKDNMNKGQALYNRNRSKRSYFKLFCREILWGLGKWHTPELDRFLDEFNPDIIMFGMEGYIHFNRICRYAQKRTSAKAIGYFWDDNFTYKQMNNIGYYSLRYFQRKSLKKLVKSCAAFWSISSVMKEEADEFFHITSDIVTKPIIYEKDEQYTPYSIESPIRILYTGNLFIGRFDSICEMSKSLAQINSNGIKAVLDVYTSTYLSEEQKKKLCIYVRIHEPVSQSEVLELQKKADILLFAEDIDGKFSRKARLSFSTKITDYLHSGKCIVALGNSDIAPIRYFSSADIALCITDKYKIYTELSSLLASPERIAKYSELSYDYGRKHHSQSIIMETVNSTIERITE